MFFGSAPGAFAVGEQWARNSLRYRALKPTSPRLRRWLHLSRKAVSLGKPWVLDPVGCGATPYRTGVAAELARLKPTIIRGGKMTTSGAGGIVTGLGARSLKRGSLSGALRLCRLAARCMLLHFGNATN